MRLILKFEFAHSQESFWNSSRDYYNNLCLL